MTRLMKLLLLLFFWSAQLFSSTNNWQKVSIPTICTFKIPNSMEIQAGTFKEQTDDLYKKMQIPFNESSVVIQQKQLNEYNKKAFQNFARILVETDYGNFGDYENIDTQIRVTKSEVQELDTTFRKEIEESFHQINSDGTMRMQLLSWTPSKIIQINGISMIKLQYTRTVNNGPEALVNIFLIQNNNRIHRITVSYRLSESNLWKSDLEKVIYTFKFEKR